MKFPEDRTKLPRPDADAGVPDLDAHWSAAGSLLNAALFVYFTAFDSRLRIFAKGGIAAKPPAGSTPAEPLVLPWSANPVSGAPADAD
jgi:hypothetical protein